MICISRFALILFFIFRCSSATAKEAVINKLQSDSLRGKLVMINECHEVRTNHSQYLEIILALTKNFKRDDTLTIFIEAPYSLSKAINNYIAGRDNFLADSIFNLDFQKLGYYTAIKKLPINIRFLGTDFEYDQGNAGSRLKAYISFFEEMKKEFAIRELDLSVLKSYLYRIRVSGLDEADIYTMKKYFQKLSERTNNSELKKLFNEALFVLSASHQWENEGQRDKMVFKRILDFTREHYNTSNNFNLMMYGSYHTSPSGENNLFRKFNSDYTSGFTGKVFLIANAYINCISGGDYYNKQFRLISNGIFAEAKPDKLFLDLVKVKAGNPQENSFTLFPNFLSGDMPYEDRILLIGLHYKVK